MLGARYRGELIAAASVCSSRTHPWRRDTSVSSVLIAVSGDASTRVRSRCDSPAESLCCSEGVNEVPAARMRYDGEGGSATCLCCIQFSTTSTGSVPGETMNLKGVRGGGQMVTGLRL